MPGLSATKRTKLQPKGKTVTCEIWNKQLEQAMTREEEEHISRQGGVLMKSSCVGTDHIPVRRVDEVELRAVDHRVVYSHAVAQHPEGLVVTQTPQQPLPQRSTLIPGGAPG